jgi:ABC-type microcin C transport system duplicated ATPase subunit YejF
VIDIQGLDVVFGHGRKIFHAVRDVSLKVEQGQSYGLVGEEATHCFHIRSGALNQISGPCSVVIGE